MPKIVLVTGANRGLGYAILQVAGLRDSSNTYILGSRDLEAGQRAKSQLKQDGVTAAIDVVQLDVTNDHQVLAAVKHVADKYGKLDGMPYRTSCLS
jgi:NAD(P)-dependent dehydrogenase (short-subunit alcohol dehydrogenase family)